MRRFLLSRLPANDLLRERNFRRLWLSVCITSFGAQITMLALPLTAVVLLKASPTQMGWLMAAEVAPFALFSLPAGVLLDRVRKLPVFLVGEALFALTLSSVPVAAWLDCLSMAWLYAVGFIVGTVHTVAGSAAQIVLTQVVDRSRLVEAHSKNALATAGAEIGGPAIAGGLIKLLGAPFTLLVDAALMAASLLLLRGLRVSEPPATRSPRPFAAELREGLAFVLGTPLLLAMAIAVGAYETVLHAAHVVHILIASRHLGLDESAIGLAHVGVGVGTVVASALAGRVQRRWGAAPAIPIGIAISGVGWLLLAAARPGPTGLPLYTLMLALHSGGATLVFVHFLALRQASTPHDLLGRMTSTMRWLILLGTGPGALLGGWIGERVDLRASLLLAAAGALAIAAWAWLHPVLRGTRELPATPDERLRTA